ncbi:MAG: hypothetical protein Q7S06_01405 [Nanoarchaeota archaeon]|nr:hypothetical protein [Nanoarchaeota archaeon]
MTGAINGQYGLGFGVLSWVTSLAVLGLIVVAIYWLIKSANRGSKEPSLENRFSTENAKPAKKFSKEKK